MAALLTTSPIAIAPATPAHAGVDLGAEIEALSRLDRHGLRVRWRKLLRSPPPDHLGRALLLRLLAYKLQARAHGDLDRETARYLDRIERERVRRRRAGEGKPKAQPPIPPVPAARSLKVGTLLAREHGGHLHRVTVMADGFAWNGTVYPSLSEIARLITGTRWNGPRFFGLRDRPTRASPGEEVRS
jgi:Protein of unknown function (DUF2924)